MKASELRIGNILQDRKGYTVFVCEIDMKDFAAYNGNAITHLPHEPILITEEWLVKLGFTFDSYADYTKKIGEDDWLSFVIKDKNLVLVDFSDTYLPKNPKYVHQLQNLYFALTGEELKIKE